MEEHRAKNRADHTHTHTSWTGLLSEGLLVTVRGRDTQNQSEHLARPGALACGVGLPGLGTLAWTSWGSISMPWVAGGR